MYASSSPSSTHQYHSSSFSPSSSSQFSTSTSTLLYQQNPLLIDPYHEVEHRGRGKKIVNPLLVKPITGKVKASTYDLPPEGFTYGKIDGYMDEGVREVVHSWHQHHPAPDSIPGRDFIRLNRSAIKNGSINSKDITNFRSNHDIRMNKSKNNTMNPKFSGTSINPDFTFGKPSGPSTPIHEVLTHSYQRQSIQESILNRIQKEEEQRNEKKNKNFGSNTTMKNISNIDEKPSANGRYGNCTHTKASLGHFKVHTDERKEPFKMEKFKNIPSRIYCDGQGRLRNQIIQQNQGQNQSFSSSNLSSPTSASSSSLHHSSSSPDIQSHSHSHPNTSISAAGHAIASDHMGSSNYVRTNRGQELMV